MSLLHHCCSQQVDPVPPNSIAINGPFITLHGYASIGPKLERHTCQSMLQCGHLCLMNPKCISFNYQVSSARNGLCELSVEGIVSNEERSKLKQIQSNLHERPPPVGPPLMSDHYSKHRFVSQSNHYVCNLS